MTNRLPGLSAEILIAYLLSSRVVPENRSLISANVKLKFEKVYYPCILLAKKRYVGLKYESRDQKIPEFDVKGIETVRRDETPADLSQVKEFSNRNVQK